MQEEIEEVKEKPKVRRRLRPFVDNIMEKGNVPKFVCDHLVGENHTFTHRLFTGFIVMGIGVMVANVHVEIVIIRYFVDGIGYLIHGIGAIPIAERVLRNNKTKQPSEDGKRFLDGE